MLCKEIPELSINTEIRENQGILGKNFLYLGNAGNKKCRGYASDAFRYIGTGCF
jgi:hypothetical protein